MLCSNVNATIYCQIDAIIAGTWSCKEHSIARLSFGTGRCFAGLSFVGPFRNSFVMDATTTFNVEEDLSLKDKALLFKMDATTNLNVAEDLSWLIWFVEVTGAHTNDVKVLRKTFVMKVTDSHTNNVQCEDAAWNLQCKDALWNFHCWSNCLKSCMRLNPTIESWIRTESCKENMGRYYKTSSFWPLPIGWLSI